MFPYNTIKERCFKTFCTTKVPNHGERTTAYPICILETSEENSVCSYSSYGCYKKPTGKQKAERGKQRDLLKLIGPHLSLENSYGRLNVDTELFKHVVAITNLFSSFPDNRECNSRHQRNRTEPSYKLAVYITTLQQSCC
ncbi:hypothetical protein CEXT_535121 [Caerostris extrusa]|uniref:Uncharacterized protein n=1 Tax=Caerostris extrusa TaxID=172846 RepID=A0AAV4RKR5_CAEEX|nr:hypothetical protein CEXT_535121 [Caerostris extrusa]